MVAPDPKTMTSTDVHQSAKKYFKKNKPVPMSPDEPEHIIIGLATALLELLAERAHKHPGLYATMITNKVPKKTNNKTKKPTKNKKNKKINMPTTPTHHKRAPKVAEHLYNDIPMLDKVFPSKINIRVRAPRFNKDVHDRKTYGVGIRNMEFVVSGTQRP